MQKAARILLYVSVAVATVGLLSYAWFQLTTGYLHGDSLIFQTVGRGWLNGALPYQDLFETKPPGVFVLHALSWKLTGSQLLVSIFTALCLLGIAIRSGAPVLGFVQGKPAHERRFLCVLSILFGLVLALYVSNQAGGGLAEAYGAYFGIAFLTALIQTVRYPYLKEVLLGVLLLLAVGFKEPFLLSILAGAILLLDTPKDAVRYFAVPTLVAVVLGLLGLLALGLLGPFFEVYLLHMLGFHVHQHDGSTFLRALEVWRTWLNLGSYSWGLAVAILTLWLATFKLAPKRWVLATYLTLFSIAIGGDFYGHHFVFAVPMYVAMWWLLLKSPKSKVQSQKWALIIIAIGLGYATLFNTKFSYSAEVTAWREHEASMKAAAQQIDEVMDACGYEKYLQMIPRVGDVFAYTNHVPYGPIFLHYSRFIGAREGYQEAYVQALQEAPLALVLDLEDANLSEQAVLFMRSNFSTDAPPCAPAEFRQPQPYTIYFRNN